jgi:hypothetical protein
LANASAKHWQMLEILFFHLVISHLPSSHPPTMSLCLCWPVRVRAHLSWSPLISSFLCTQALCWPLICSILAFSYFFFFSPCMLTSPYCLALVCRTACLWMCTCLAWPHQERDVILRPVWAVLVYIMWSAEVKVIGSKPFFSFFVLDCMHCANWSAHCCLCMSATHHIWCHTHCLSPLFWHWLLPSVL